MDKVHRGRADKTCDKQVGRAIIQIKRRPHLLDDAVMHHHNLVGHGHRFDLVMGHIDGGCFEALVQFLDFGAHLHAKFGIQVGQRFVKQEHLRIADNGAAHGNALALATRKLAGIAIKQVI